MPYDRKIFFDNVRVSLFSGGMTQQQVNGMEAILADWEGTYEEDYPDKRYLAYALATAKWETASTMWPIEEYGKGAGQPYGVRDPETGQTYYGRGYVQLTWRDNYRNSTSKLGLTGTKDDMEWHAERALDPFIAGHVMFRGMIEGWFRKTDGVPNTLYKYFNPKTNDAYTAREIINGDKTKVPTWTGGVNVGNYIANDHKKFLTALEAAYTEGQAPAPPEPPPTVTPVMVGLSVPVGQDYEIYVNNVQVVKGRA